MQAKTTGGSPLPNTYIDRCRYVRQLGLGFSLSLYLYKVPAASCMQFVAQLAQVPKWVLKLEKQGLDIITGGPTNWLSSQALSCLDEFVGFHFVVPSLVLVCYATIARAAHVSVQNWRECAAIMDGGWADNERALFPRLSSWYESSMAWPMLFVMLTRARLALSGIVLWWIRSVLRFLTGSRKVQPRLMQILCPDIANFDALRYLTTKIKVVRLFSGPQVCEQGYASGQQPS